MNQEQPPEETDAFEGRIRIRLASRSPESTSGSDTESIQPENENPILFSSDDSTEVFFQGLNDFILKTSNDSLDKALLGDTSEEVSTSPTSNSDVDPGLPRCDYLDFEKCLLCSTDRKNISYPYCARCYTWRKNFYPSRPKRRKKYYFKRAKHCPGALNKRSNISVSQNSNNESVYEEEKSTNDNLNDGLLEGSGVGSKEPNLSEGTVDGPSQPSTLSLYLRTNSGACRVCYLNHEDGLFVHLNSAHLYGCYTCAKRIWYNIGCCPICRRKVSKITKLFV